ncbi:hypothetical protein [Brevundimonas naejangsanensis]|uniref:hypothetical protein n=1 Tax=Brevundimonas naejangsanensis TaxID=588932 RepID=UPI00106A0B0B|nr:hypothetical protein [Brevundimonas naejangsanensis]QBQ47481.1 hypothetical protein E3U41_01565 [Brevundimonas naejangsanensis]
MISARLRSVLSVLSVIVIFGGPLFCIAAGVIGLPEVDGPQALGRAIASLASIFFGSVLGGGLLRVLISIDARMEQSA